MNYKPENNKKEKSRNATSQNDKSLEALLAVHQYMKYHIGTIPLQFSRLIRIYKYLPASKHYAEIDTTVLDLCASEFSRALENLQLLRQIYSNSEDAIPKDTEMVRNEFFCPDVRCNILYFTKQPNKIRNITQYYPSPPINFLHVADIENACCSYNKANTDTKSTAIKGCLNHVQRPISYADLVTFFSTIVSMWQTTLHIDADLSQFPTVLPAEKIIAFSGSYIHFEMMDQASIILILTFFTFKSTKMLINISKNKNMCKMEYLKTPLQERFLFSCIFFIGCTLFDYDILNCIVSQRHQLASHGGSKSIRNRVDCITIVFVYTAPITTYIPLPLHLFPESNVSSGGTSFSLRYSQQIAIILEKIVFIDIQRFTDHEKVVGKFKFLQSTDISCHTNCYIELVKYVNQLIVKNIEVLRINKIVLRFISLLSVISTESLAEDALSKILASCRAIFSSKNYPTDVLKIDRNLLHSWDWIALNNQEKHCYVMFPNILKIHLYVASSASQKNYSIITCCEHKFTPFKSAF